MYVVAKRHIKDVLRRLSGEEIPQLSVDTACIGLTGVTLDDDFVPFDSSLPELPHALERFLDIALDPKELFEECISRDEYVRAERLIALHHFDESFIDRVDRARRSRRKELTESLSELQVRIEDAVLLDQLDPRGEGLKDGSVARLDRSSLLAKINDGLSKLSTGGVELSASIPPRRRHHQRCQGSGQSIDSESARRSREGGGTSFQGTFRKSPGPR